MRLPRWTVYPALLVLIGLPAAFVVDYAKSDPFAPRTAAEPTSGAARGAPIRAQAAAPRFPRVIVLGIDGLDPEILAEAVERHPELTPNFRWLIEAQGLHSLSTSTPPQSPVAWSNFTTGLDPGGHGVFDFIHRDPVTRGVLPSTTRESAPGWMANAMSKLPLPGGYALPATGTTDSNRTGKAFWTLLKEAGVPADIWRMPANFPVIPSKGVSFSGMMTPALDSAYGQCTLYSTRPAPPGAYERQVTISERRDSPGRIDTYIEGPTNLFQPDAHGHAHAAKAPLTFYVDRQAKALAIEGGHVPLVLKPGQWSEFVRIPFKLLPMGMSDISGVVRFYLRSLEPELELYASAVNIDPLAPAMPVSEPSSASAEVARQIGIYYTQGMAEDVSALKKRLIDEREFVQQVELVYDESRRMLDIAIDRYLERGDGGLLFFYFSTVDLTSHMLYRLCDPKHPAYDAALAATRADGFLSQGGASWRDAIWNLVLVMDPVLGELRERVGEDATFVVMSDHGFAPYRRAFHLNTWLLEHGYLVLREGQERELEPTADAFRERYLSSVLATTSPVAGRVARIEPTPAGGQAIVIADASGAESRAIVPAAAKPTVAVGASVEKDQALSDAYTLVDWSKTRAYGVGFQGLYLNLAGREQDVPGTAADERGTVEPAQAAQLLEQLRNELCALRDPAGGEQPIVRCDLAREVYHGARVAEAPDLIVGYNAGYGNSDQATQGRIPWTVLEDNLGGSFNGSHLMSPEVVRGTLLSNRKVRAGQHGLEDLTVEVLHEFGLPPGPGMQGHPVLE